MNDWNKLSMRDRAAFIRLEVANGYTDIDSIRLYYNESLKGNILSKGGEFFKLHKSRWNNFLLNKGLSPEDANRLSDFFAALDGLESVNGTSDAAINKNNFGGMQVGSRNIKYPSIDAYMEAKYNMMKDRFDDALKAKSVKEYATILGDPARAGKKYLYYVVNGENGRPKYNPKDPEWIKAQTIHMNNYIGGMLRYFGDTSTSILKYPKVAPHVEQPDALRVTKQVIFPSINTDSINNTTIDNNDTFVPKIYDVQDDSLNNNKVTVLPEVLVTAPDLSKNKLYIVYSPDEIQQLIEAFTAPYINTPYMILETPKQASIVEKMQLVNKDNVSLLQLDLKDTILKNNLLAYYDLDKLRRKAEDLIFIENFNNISALGGNLYPIGGNLVHNTNSLYVSPIEILPEEIEVSPNATLRRSHKVFSNYNKAKDNPLSSFTTTIRNAARWVKDNVIDIPSGVSNCTLSASLWIDPANPIKNASSIIANPEEYNYIPIEEKDARLGDVLITRNPNDNSYHTMVVSGYTPEAGVYNFDGTDFAYKANEPLLTYSRGGHDVSFIRRNIPLSVYMPNSDGKTEKYFYRYERPNTVLNALLKKLNGGNIFLDGGVHNARELPEVYVTPFGNFNSVLYPMLSTLMTRMQLYDDVNPLLGDNQEKVTLKSIKKNGKPGRLHTAVISPEWISYASLAALDNGYDPVLPIALMSRESTIGNDTDGPTTAKLWSKENIEYLKNMGVDPYKTELHIGLPFLLAEERKQVRQNNIKEYPYALPKLSYRYNTMIGDHDPYEGEFPYYRIYDEAINNVGLNRKDLERFLKENYSKEDFKNIPIDPIIHALNIFKTGKYNSGWKGLYPAVLREYEEVINNPLIMKIINNTKAFGGNLFAPGGEIEDEEYKYATTYLPEVTVTAPRLYIERYDENANPVYTTDYIKYSTVYY